MGVVVSRYIDILTIIINFPYSTCISSFFGSSIPTSLFILKCFCTYIDCIVHVCIIIIAEILYTTPGLEARLSAFPILSCCAGWTHRIYT